MPEPTVYVAADRRCGHPICGFGDRAQGQRHVQQVLGDYARHVEVREASDGDLIRLLRGVRCAACTADGREVSHA